MILDFYACTHTDTHKQTHAHAHTHTHTHTLRQTHTHTRTHTHTFRLAVDTYSTQHTCLAIAMYGSRGCRAIARTTLCSLQAINIVKNINLTVTSKNAVTMEMKCHYVTLESHTIGRQYVSTAREFYLVIKLLPDTTEGVWAT